MKKVVFLFLAIVFVFASCEKTELESMSHDEVTLKNGTKVLNFRTHLKGENEVPSVETMATGQATFQLNKEGTELSYKLIVSNIENVRMAHIHYAPEGQNGGVVAWLYSGGLILGNVNGVLAEGKITAANLTGALAGSTMQDLIDAFYAGMTYVNVHTNQVPSGEIRGQITGNMPMGN